MRSTRLLPLVGITISMLACSTEDVIRTSYETLQNIQEIQCQKDLSVECPERESYDAYQRKLQDSGNSD